MAVEKRINKRQEVQDDYFYYQTSKDEKYKCRLMNISATGACINSEDEIKIDEIIFLHIRGMKDMELKSRAVWKIDKQYGIQFVLDTSHEFEKISYIMNYVF